MSRWRLVDLVRQLSTAAFKDGNNSEIARRWAISTHPGNYELMRLVIFIFSEFSLSTISCL